MKIPNWKNLHISQEKLTGYLLSTTHPVGKYKANFLQALGFNEGNVNILKQGLIIIAQDNEVVDTITNIYGTKYVIDGNLQSPNNVEVVLRTVWIIEKHVNMPRFVTAYPR